MTHLSPKKHRYEIPLVILRLKKPYSNKIYDCHLETPSNIRYEILDRIVKVENVLSSSDEHFWNLSSSTIVGTIHIQISNDGDEQRVTAQVQANFKEAQIQNIAVQVEKQVFFNHLTGLNSALGQLDTSQRTFSHKQKIKIFLHFFICLPPIFLCLLVIVFI